MCTNHSLSYFHSSSNFNNLKPALLLVHKISRLNPCQHFSRLKTELQFLRKKGALKSSSNSEQQQQPEEGITNNGRCCARCRTGLGRIINRGALCKSCRQRVCKACREYNLQRTSTAITGPDWVCTVCYKNA